MRTHVSISPAATPTPPRPHPRALTRLLAALTLLLAPALPSLAQQLPNPSFNNWKGDGNAGSTEAFSKSWGRMTSEFRQRPNDEPSEWNGSSVNQNVVITAKKELITKGTENGNIYAILTNKYVGVGSIGSTAPGYITLGTPWVYAETTVSNCDGGTYGGINFTHRPDAISIKMKRTDSNNEHTNVIFYSWTGSFKSDVGTATSPDQERTDVDRAVIGRVTPTSSGVLIGKAEQTFTHEDLKDGTNFVSKNIEISYPGNGSPEKMNIIISAGEYWVRGNMNEDTSLSVDDVLLLYYSRLKNIVYNDKSYTFDANNNLTLTDAYLSDFYDTDNSEYDFSSIAVNLLGEGQTATYTITEDTATNQIKIVVSNDNGDDYDGESSHTYTIQCATPSIDDISINYVRNGVNGTYSDFTLTDDFLTFPGYYDEIAEDSNGNKQINVKINGAEAEISPLSNDYTFTISFPVSSVETKTYTIQCWVPVSGLEFLTDILSAMENDQTTVVDLSSSLFTFLPADNQYVAEKEIDYSAVSLVALDDNGAESGEIDPEAATITRNGQSSQFTIQTKHWIGNFGIKVASKNGTTAIHTVEVTPADVESIKFGNEDNYGIFAGRSKTFTAADLVFTPSNAWDKGIEWTYAVSEPEIAGITNANGELKIVAIKKGTVTITATSTANPDATAEATIEISDELVVPEFIVSANRNDVPEEIFIGKTEPFKIDITYFPANYNAEIISTRWWTDEENSDVINVTEDGLISIVDGATPKDGVKIYVESVYENDGTEATVYQTEPYSINILQPVEGIKVIYKDEEITSLTIPETLEGESIIFDYVILPETASNQELSVEIRPSSSDEKTILEKSSDNEFTTADYGDNIIRIAATDKFGYAVEIPVTVLPIPDEIKIIGLDKDVYPNKTYKLSTEITPSEATKTPGVKVEWTSSDTKIATIDEDGTLNILKEGNVTITASTYGDVADPKNLTIEAYKGINKTVEGQLDVTTSTDKISLPGKSLTMIATSETEMDLTIKDVRISGMRLGNITVTDATYSTNDNNETQISFSNKEVELLGGSVLVSISGNGSTNDNSTNLYIDIIAYWEDSNDPEEASAYFSTDVPEEPGEPVVGEGTKTVYPGKISFSVVANDENGDDEEGPAESFVVKTVVTVIDPRPDKTEEHNVDIKIPDLHFGEIDWDMWSSRASFDEEAENYLYNFHAMTLKGVTASTVGSTVKYEFDGTATADDDETITYTVTLKGTANTQNGDARIQLSIMDPVSGEELGGAFANSEDEGDIYSGKLTINMGGTDLTEGDGQDATVNIIPSADGLTATFLLPNFTLEGIGALGDIRVDDVEIEDYEDGSKGYFGSVQGMQLLDGEIVADVNLEGYVDADGYAEMTIMVVWSGINIECHFNGKRTAGGNTTGIEAVETATDAPAIYFTIRGIRAAEPLAPGLYIERRGSKARKIIVR